MWYLVQRRPVLPRDQWPVQTDDHLAWMKEQHEKGVVVLSGPAWLKGKHDTSTVVTSRPYPADTIGMYVVRAPSLQEANGVAEADPFTAAGCCAFDIFEWDVHQIMGIGPFTAKELGRG